MKNVSFRRKKTDIRLSIIGLIVMVVIILMCLLR